MVFNSQQNDKPWLWEWICKHPCELIILYFEINSSKSFSKKKWNNHKHSAINVPRSIFFLLVLNKFSYKKKIQYIKCYPSIYKQTLSNQDFFCLTPAGSLFFCLIAIQCLQNQRLNQMSLFKHTLFPHQNDSINVYLVYKCKTCIVLVRQQQK